MKNVFSPGMKEELCFFIHRRNHENVNRSKANFSLHVTVLHLFWSLLLFYVLHFRAVTVYVFMEFVLVFGAYEVLARQERSGILPLNKKQQLVLPENYKASAVCCSFSQQ